jgi:hypothetical protein
MCAWGGGSSGVRAAGAVLILLAFGGPGALAAQAPADSAPPPPRLTVQVSRDSAGALRGALVRAQHLMADGVAAGALRQGFSARFTVRVGLWRDGRFVDREERSVAWENVVLLDPIAARYELIRSTGDVERFTSLARLDTALALPAMVELAPSQPDARYYFVASVEMTTLSVSEVEEVERWLRGDLGRAVTERGDVGSALGRGARLVLVRLSGLPSRRLETRTPTVAAR